VGRDYILSWILAQCLRRVGSRQVVGHSSRVEGVSSALLSGSVDVPIPGIHIGVNRLHRGERSSNASEGLAIRGDAVWRSGANAVELNFEAAYNNQPAGCAANCQVTLSPSLSLLCPSTDPLGMPSRCRLGYIFTHEQQPGHAPTATGMGRAI
jgi:hypothetical protein